jgi:hypothetical protein
MNAHPAMLSWPVEAGDDLGLALWTARDIAAATGAPHRAISASPASRSTAAPWPKAICSSR